MTTVSKYIWPLNNPGNTLNIFPNGFAISFSVQGEKQKGFAKSLSLCKTLEENQKNSFKSFNFLER
jgi:hypothetical protein